MKLNFKFLLLILTLLFLSGCNLPFGAKKIAALSVTASPQSAIFLDGKHIGSTPFFDQKLKPGEYSIKIMPESGIGMSWESRVKLAAGTMTVISRQIGETQDRSSGYVLSLEPEISKDKISLQVITSPDSSVVSVDSEARGFSPIALDDISEGEHVLMISSPGYIEQSVNAKLESGYKLIVNVQLAKSEIISKEEKTEKKSDVKEEILDEDLKQVEEDNEKKLVGEDLEPPYVIIEETPTGWLNARKKPTTADDNIIKKIHPDEKYKYLDANDIGWYQIELEDGEEAWISGKYAKLVKD